MSQNNVETALESAGVSLPAASAYRTAVMRAIGNLIATMIESGESQLFHDITVNVPEGIITDLDEDRAQAVVVQAAVRGLTHYLEWDIAAAKEAAVLLLEEVNYHDAAALLAAYDEES